MGRIGTVIQQIDSLETHQDKAIVAEAVKEKIGPKAFKKHKQKEYLTKLIQEKTILE